MNERERKRGRYIRQHNVGVITRNAHIIDIPTPRARSLSHTRRRERLRFHKAIGILPAPSPPCIYVCT